MLVSIIIPHKNRTKLLVKTIDSICRQSFRSTSIEIIIVTQNANLSKQLNIADKHPSIKIYQQDSNSTISVLRNFGVSRSHGEYLAFLDADVSISSNWLEEMLLLLEENTERTVVSAVQRCSTQASPLEQIRTFLSNVTVDSRVAFLPGRNLFMHRSTYLLVGGFPDHLVTCEDYYFTDKAAQLGELYYSSNANYIHLGEDKIYREMFNKEIWRAQSNIHSIQGRLIPLREVPSFIVPIAVTACWLLAIAFLVTGYLTASLELFIIGMIPVFIYSLRLHRIAKKALSLSSIVKFYSHYFPARGIGTIMGMFRPVPT